MTSSSPLSPSFLKALSRVEEHEGGYSDHPSDPGGKTMFGITERVARRYNYKGEMRLLPFSLAQEIYEAEYWRPIRGDELPFPLSFQLFDFAINSGPPWAISSLQSILKLSSDGIFGPQTFRAIQALEEKHLKRLPADLIRARMAFQTRLPTWPAFGKGWTSRNIQNFTYLLEDLGVF